MLYDLVSFCNICHNAIRHNYVTNWIFIYHRRNLDREEKKKKAQVEGENDSFTVKIHNVGHFNISFEKTKLTETKRNIMRFSIVLIIVKVVRSI